MQRRTAFLLLAVLLTSAWLLQQSPGGLFPRMPSPPPVPERALRSSGTQARIVFHDVSFTTSLLAEVQLPLLELTPHVPALGKPVTEIDVGLIRMVGLRVISPIDTIHV